MYFVPSYRRIALIINGVHERKIYFEVQLDVNLFGSLEGEMFAMGRDVLWNRFFTPKCETSEITGISIRDR